MLAAGLPFLNEIVALFVASVAIAYLCYRLRLVPIAGFLIAGVLIGPGALGVVARGEVIDTLAEVGVILLLFTIGMEFSFGRVVRIGRSILVGGGIQVVSTVAVVTALLAVAGVGTADGVFTGFLVALSSTAIVLGLLSDQDRADTPAGQLSLAILIFQDLAVVAMVLLVPILAGRSGSLADLLMVAAKAAGLIAATLVLARRVVPWLLEHVARTRRQELFLLTVVAVGLGTAALSSYAGVSLALGAFLAGLVVSESRYRDQALSEILPLRTLFNAVFFVSVGMLLDLGFVARNLPLVLVSACVVLAVKVIATTGSVLALRFPVRIAAAVGLALAQIGEFSFVLERAGREAGLTPAGIGEVGSQAFIAATVLLMLLTPLLTKAAPRFGDLLSALSRPSEGAPAPRRASSKGREDHVVVVGYGPAGRRLVRVLRERSIPFVVVEMNPGSVAELRSEGLETVFGDASRPAILGAAGIRQAKLCVIVVNDPDIAPRIIRQARYLNPTLQIIARTRRLADLERLQTEGADIVVPEEMETTVRIFSHVLGAYLIPADEIDRHVRMIRADDYGVMRGSIQEAHLMVLQGLDEDGMHTRAVAVHEDTPAAGRTLAELSLRRTHGLTVLAVRRGGRTVASPAGDFVVEAGDRLVMVGEAHRFAGCAGLFRRPTDAPADPRPAA